MAEADLADTDADTGADTDRPAVAGARQGR